MIFKTQQTQNFTQIQNSLLESAMPPKAKAVLIYLLSKPADWQIRLSDIKHRLGLSTYSARQALKWLCDNGFAFYQRLKSGHTVWAIFDSPQSTDTPARPDIPPQVEKPQVDNQHDLITLRESVISKTNDAPPTTPERIPEQESPPTPDNVVVDGLTEKEQAPARKAMSGLTIEQIQLVLSVYAYNLSRGDIQNRVAYFIGLCKSARNGTLTPVSAPKTESAGERIEREKAARQAAQERGKLSNAEWFSMMAQRFGSRFTDSAKGFETV